MLELVSPGSCQGMDTSRDGSAGAPHADCVGGLRAAERDARVCVRAVCGGSPENHPKSPELTLPGHTAPRGTECFSQQVPGCVSQGSARAMELFHVLFHTSTKALFVYF